jgi:hypothetical protein
MTDLVSRPIASPILVISSLFSSVLICVHLWLESSSIFCNLGIWNWDDALPNDAHTLRAWYGLRV